MSILIIDDSIDSIMLIQNILKKNGYAEVLTAQSANEAFEYLGINNPDNKNEKENIDIILLDIVMPEMDGIETLKRVKSNASLIDIPVVMVTAQDNNSDLAQAFGLGAVDYVTKPINKIELLSRIRSVLNLKHEMDRRMELMRELEEANKKLQRLTFIDGLTGIANRRFFDQTLESEWNRVKRDKKPISLVMIDIDFFKKYNDHHGHQGGDDCLIQVAQAIDKVQHRPGDLSARYGGEEFTIIFPDTNAEQALNLAEKCKSNVVGLKIPHGNSDVSEYVTLSLGVATMTPSIDLQFSTLIHRADKALYKAKEQGRNRVESFD